MRILFTGACLAVIASGYLYVKDRLDDPPATLVTIRWYQLHWPGEDDKKPTRETVNYSRLSACMQEVERRREDWRKKLDAAWKLIEPPALMEGEKWTPSIDAKWAAAKEKNPLATAMWDAEMKSLTSGPMHSCERRSIW